jgi:tungstate transport system ATP-binding protein
MSLYALENISKTHNGRTVLYIPGLSIERDAIYSLTGPNGAGKTTLLHILSFLMPPSAGRLFFNGQIAGKSERQLQQLRKKVVLVNQHPIMFSSTVQKNVAFGLRVRGAPRQQTRQVVEQSLEAVGMEAFADSDARFLSGGETRRVAIARALACQPEVLLLDEPTADLDLESQQVIEQIIRTIHQTRQMTILFCTHNLRQAARLTDRNIYLLDGQMRTYFHENIFSAQVVEKDGQTYARITAHVWIPVAHRPGEAIKISIDPKAIELFAPNGTGASAQQGIAGRVVELVDDHGAVRALVDIGVQLTMVLDKTAYQNRRPGIGESVNIGIRPEGVDIITLKSG